MPLPKIYVTANFKETQLTRMQPGQAAEIFIDAYPDHKVTGRIESFAPASGSQFSLLPPDNATGNFTKIVQRVPVRIALPADAPVARFLRPGLSVTVTVDTRAESDIEAQDGLVGAAQAHPRFSPMSTAETLNGRRPQPSRRNTTTSPTSVPRRMPSPAEPTLREWLGVLAMVGGMFMAIMDVQIVTSSLTQIQGGLSASPDEISWVQTAYLIADVVMVPLSGTMSRLLSTRVWFVIATLGFTGASVLCATATSLPEMIVYRALQGFSAGAISPAIFPVVYTIFPPRQLASVMVLISLILNLSSTLGRRSAAS